MQINVYLNSEKEIVETIARLLEMPCKTSEGKDKNGMFIYQIEVQIEKKYSIDFEQIIARSFKIHNKF